MDGLTGGPRPVVHRAVALEQNLCARWGNIPANQPGVLSGVLIQGQSGDPLKRDGSGGQLGGGGAVDTHLRLAFGDDVQVFCNRIDQQGFCVAFAVRVAKGNCLNVGQGLASGLPSPDPWFWHTVDIFQITSRPVIANIADIQVGSAGLGAWSERNIFPVVVLDTVQHIGAEMDAPGAERKHPVWLSRVIMDPEHPRIFLTGDNARGFADGRVFNQPPIHPLPEARRAAGRLSSPAGQDQTRHTDQQR